MFINNIVIHNIKGGDQVIDWVKNRIAERTTWDAGVIIAGSLAVLFLGGIVKIGAYAGLAKVFIQNIIRLNSLIN